MTADERALLGIDLLNLVRPEIPAVTDAKKLEDKNAFGRELE